MRVLTKEDIEGRELTDDEKGWLVQRDRHAEVAKNEELFGGDYVEGEPGASDPDNYDSWKNQELLDEGAKRDPAVDFAGCTKKSDYVAALRAWDEEYGE